MAINQLNGVISPLISGVIPPYLALVKASLVRICLFKPACYNQLSYHAIVETLRSNYASCPRFKAKTDKAKIVTLSSHTIHGTGIFTHIYHKNQPNVGIYIYHTWMVKGLTISNPSITSHSRHAAPRTITPDVFLGALLVSRSFWMVNSWWGFSICPVGS